MEATPTTDKADALRRAKRQAERAAETKRLAELYAVQAYRAGASYAEVGAALGVTRAAIAKLLERHQVQPRAQGHHHRNGASNEATS